MKGYKRCNFHIPADFENIYNSYLMLAEDCDEFKDLLASYVTKKGKPNKQYKGKTGLKIRFAILKCAEMLIKENNQKEVTR